MLDKEHFAYVPDPAAPDTWQVQIAESAERGVTRKQLAKAGHALSDVPPEHLAEVKARIRAEYRSLGILDKNIPQSVKETEPMSRVLGQEVFALEEAEFNADKGEVTVTVIKPGFNTSGARFYPRETLARDYKIFEGNKMFADHPTAREEREQPERSVRSWVGQIRRVFVAEDGSVKARADIVQPWFQSHLAALKEKNLLGEMGVSIVAVGEGVKTKMEGKTTTLIERLVKGRSVDFVTYPGAGGQVDCFESDRDGDPMTYDVDLIDAAVLRSTRPDLIEIIEGELAGQTSAEERTHMDEMEVKLAELKEANETLASQNVELTTKVAAQEATVAKAEVDKLIADADVPAATKARLTAQFSEATSVDGVAEAIEAATIEIAALREAGVVKGVGDTTPTPESRETETATKDALRESRYETYRAQGKDESTAKRMAAAFVEGR